MKKSTGIKKKQARLQRLQVADSAE
ncbi:MAG: hypothetical protein H6Q21_1558, partial [Bacteroidetes bacterium]|nr:hypothetical protein [Bacteroidota bacterium]